MNLATFRPTYFSKRVRRWYFERVHPDCPWLTESAVLLLDTWLKPTDVGLEWGSGRSTVWFSRRAANLTSVEDNPQWYERVSRQLAKNGHEADVDHRFVPCELGEYDEPESHPYADVALELSDGSLDFVLVGRQDPAALCTACRGQA